MNLNHFDLNLLRALDALIVERSVTRAADRLCLTQQALSAALHRLRDHFDDRLLVRVGREMELTPLGEALTEPVRSALRQIQRALDTRPSFDPSVTSLVAHIAASDYPTFVLLPQLMRTLTTEAPGVACRMKMLDVTSFQALEEGDLDFCFSPIHWALFGSYTPSQDIRTRQLFRDDYVCVVDRAHPDVGCQMTMEDYRRLPHNCTHFGHGVKTWVEQGWCEAKLHLTIAATTPNFLASLHMLPGTPLVATVQRRLAEAFARPLGLRILECPFPIRPLSWHLAWHARSDQDPGHAYLRATIMAAASRLPDEMIRTDTNQYERSGGLLRLALQ